MYNFDAYGWGDLVRDLVFMGGCCVFVSGLGVRAAWWQWCGLGCSLFLLRGWMNAMLDNLRIVAQEVLEQQELRSTRIAECVATHAEF
jgi:hypothetical protein